MPRDCSGNANAPLAGEAEGLAASDDVSRPSAAGDALEQ
jgi:hypothetical protein